MYKQKIGGFEIKAFFDRDRKKLINKVTYRRKELPTKVLKDHLSKNYIGRRLIITDLKMIQSWADIALDLLSKKSRSTEDNCILTSLFISMVTTYWKCFADTKGRHGVKLDKKLVCKDYLSVHEELRRIRHNFAAHSGKNPFESGYLLIVKDIAGKSRFDPISLPIQRKAGHADESLTKNIRKITASLIAQLELKQQKLMDKIMMSAV